MSEWFQAHPLFQSLCSAKEKFQFQIDDLLQIFIQEYIQDQMDLYKSDQQFVFINIFMSVDLNLKDRQFIKNSKLSYLKCTEGDIHEGQQLTFVCVQSKCNKKGLICPVCRVNQHENHKTIPLKVFLSEIRDKFLDQKNQNGNPPLVSLSDYLRQMENIRQQLLTVLRDTVTVIAEKVKKVQQQIFENYSNIRKLVLTQSTISTKLPGLISLMLDPKDRDPKQIQQQFKKYASLLIYEKDEIDFLDNSKKIVEDYSHLPGTVNLHLSTVLPTITKIFDSLPLNLQKSEKPPVMTFSFNQKAKLAQIKISEDQKEAYFDPATIETGGYVIVKEGQGVQHQSISFRVTDTDSGCITLGLALPDLIKSKNYTFQQVDINHGLYCISAVGFTYQHNNAEKQESESCFPFGVGDTIDIQWNAKTKKLDFSRRHGVEKYTMDINLPDADLSKLQFTVGIFGENDRISIVEE